MANFRTGADLLADVLFRAGELTDGSSDFDAQALKAINRVWQAIWSGGGELEPTVHESWWWLRKSPPGVITLIPSIGANVEDGTAAVINGSVNGTFSSTPISLQGRFIRFGDHPDVFRIASHVAFDTSFILDSIYTGPSDPTSSFLAVKMEYDLAADALELISPMRVFQQTADRIEGVDLQTLEVDWPTRIFQPGIPEQFSPIGNKKVRFSHYGYDDPTQFVRVEYEYLYQPDDIANNAVEPPIPFQYRRVISDYALYFIFSDKNDNRSEGVGALAKSGLEAMARDHRARQLKMDTSFGRVFPRGGPQRNTGPLRTTSGFIIG